MCGESADYFRQSSSPVHGHFHAKPRLHLAIRLSRVRTKANTVELRRVYIRAAHARSSMPHRIARSVKHTRTEKLIAFCSMHSSPLATLQQVERLSGCQHHLPYASSRRSTANDVNLSPKRSLNTVFVFIRQYVPV